MGNPIKVKPVEMKTLDLVDVLNNGRGDNGTKWGQSSEGFPYFGENQSYKPDTEVWPELPAENQYQVEFSAYNGSAKETLTDSRLQVSPDSVNAFKVAGRLSLKDYQAPELYRDEAVRSNGNGPFFRRSVCIQKRKNTYHSNTDKQ